MATPFCMGQKVYSIGVQKFRPIKDAVSPNRKPAYWAGLRTRFRINKRCTILYDLHPELKATFHRALLSPRRGPRLPKPSSPACSTANSGLRTGPRCFFAADLTSFSEHSAWGRFFTVWRQGQRRQPKTVIRVGCAVSGPRPPRSRSRPMIHNFKGIFEHFRAIYIVKRFSGK